MACIAKRRGRYVIDFYDNQGKRRWKTLPIGTTKKKARESMREIEDQVARGIYLPDKKIPLFSRVAEDWLEYKKPNLRQSTWSVYEGHTRNHFHDLDDLKINRISTIKIEKFIGDRQNQGMNISTIKKILVTLGQIMAYAVRHKYIDYNPVRDAERPSGHIKYIQNQLGHSSPTVTMNVYAHLMKKVNQEAACRLENTIFETSGSKMVAEKKKEVAEYTITS